MNVWIKRARLLAIVSAGAALIAGCSKKQEIAGADGSPVFLELWYGSAITEAGPPPADWKALKIIKERFNIDLKITALPSAESDQDVKINAAGASNNLPDIFMVRRPILLKLIDQGLVAEVDDMYDMMPNRTKTHYTEGSRTHTTIDGASWGLADPGSISGNEGILIRKDWLDKLGLSVPITTEDYLNVMRAFTFNDPDGNGKNDTWGYGAFLEITVMEEGLGRRLDPFMGAFGVAGTWDMSKESPGLNLFKPEFYDAMEFVKRMCDEGVIDPNWMSYKKDDFRAAWKQGKFGMMREQNSAFASEASYTPFDNNFPDGEWIVIDPPVGPSGKSSVGAREESYRIYAVSAKAADAGKKQAIAKVLEWMASDEGYYLLGWGEEGVNWVRDANGIPSVEGIPYEQQWSNPKNIALTQLRNMVFVNNDIELVSRYPTYRTSVSGKEMSALTVLHEMQAKPWTNTTGASMLPVPNADIKRFYEQGLLEFLTGRRSLTRDNWNAWLEEFRRLGGDAWNQSGIRYATENELLH